MRHRSRSGGNRYNAQEVWVEQDIRKTEWTLIKGEQLYALGEHTTIGGANTDLDRRQDVGALLAQWKRTKVGWPIRRQWQRADRSAGMGDCEKGRGKSC
jgi:hypothetical protein